MNTPLVTVSMPYHGCPQTVRRAVDAVLAQTMTDFRLVVVNDGDTSGDAWAPLADITDPRLVRFDLGENHGRYFADAVVLEACGSPWFAIHDADDEADPEWLGLMIGATLDPVDPIDWVSTAQRVEGANGTFSTENVRPFTTRPPGLVHYAHMAGLWRTTWLSEVAGGPHPAYRVGYDTVLSMIARTWGVGVNIGMPLYTRYRRIGSLTSASSTGMRSAYRRTVRAQLTDLWRRIRALEPKRSAKPGDIVRHEAAGGGWNLLVGRYARALLKQIDEATAAPAPRHPGAPLIEPPDPALLAATRDAMIDMTKSSVDAWPPPVTLDNSDGPFDEAPPDYRRVAMPITLNARLWSIPWSLGQATAFELDNFLTETRPRRMVEFGSGASSLVLASHAAHTGAQLSIFEHDPKYFALTKTMLRERGLWRDEMLYLRPLAKGSIGPLYSGPIPVGVDFALIDGPPESTGGRREIVRMAHGILHPGGCAWLDDAGRDGERIATEDWLDFGATGRKSSAIFHRWGGRAVAELIKDESVPAMPPLVDDVVVTVLAGGRPDLLARTLDGLYGVAGLQRVSVYVVLNSDDRKSHAVANGVGGSVNVVMPPSSGMLSIGEGVQACAEIARASGAALWLHLEDDWLADTTDRFWLQRAAYILASQEDVAQVRLRHAGEKTLPYHMLTKRPIVWTPDDHLGTLVAPEAHWTFNPSLVRVTDVAEAFGSVKGERHAQMIAHDLGLDAVAQLYPGVFRHIGDAGRSLADRTGKR